MANEESGSPPAGNGSGNDAANGNGAHGDAPAVEGPDQMIARLEREKAELKDRLYRTAADLDNFRKRARRDEDDAVFRAREQILREVLGVMDNLERANAAVGKGGSVESLAQGIKLVEKQFVSALEKFNVKPFEALGEAFDPSRHEAIQQVETADRPAGSVASVFARGYFLGERLLRPAMVAVAKAPPASAPGDGGDA